MLCLEDINMSDEYSKVVVTDIKIPFRSMVILMVKWAVATIPALIILSVIGSIIFWLITALMGGWHMRMWSM
jgi:hypothetical protein